MSLTTNNLGSGLLHGGGRVASARALPSEKVMAEQIKVGTVLGIPDYLKVESEPYSKGWRLVSNLNGYGLGRKIREAGWTFFDLAQIKASVFGFDREKAARRALNRVLANVKSDERFLES